MTKKITKKQVTWYGLLDVITESVRDWKPTELSRENQYSAALADYLREVCPPDTRVETEYRDGGTTVDVWLSWQGLLFSDQLFIELKRNLRKKTDYDRLVGQIVALKPGNRRILIVLIGDTSDKLLGRLTEHFQTELEESEESMRIVTIKPISDGSSD